MNKNLQYYQLLVQLAKKQGISRPLWNSTLFGVKLELKALPKYLSQGERIYCLVPCKYKGKKALAVVTDIRVMCLNRGLLGDLGNTQREDIYYNQAAGGNPHGSLISSYTISVPGTGNDFEIDGLWLNDAKVFDFSFNKARQDYEKRKLETKETTSTETNTEKKSSYAEEVLEKLRVIREMKQKKEINTEEFVELVEEVLVD